jgi:hypothetical protein
MQSGSQSGPPHEPPHEPEQSEHESERHESRSGSQSGPPHEPPHEHESEQSDRPESTTQGSELPSGLPNLGNSSYINSAIWFLNAVPEFREDIIERGNENPLIVALGEIFKGINSPDGIEEDPLRKLLEERILPELNEYSERESNEEKSKLHGENDVFSFIDWCLMNIRSEESQLVKCFKSKFLKITEKTFESANKEGKNDSQLVLDLPIKRDTRKKKIDEEFMNALRAWGDQEKLKHSKGKTVIAIRYQRIVNPPKNLLIHIEDDDEDVKKMRVRWSYCRKLNCRRR